MTIYSVTRNSNRNDILCPSCITNFTRIGQDTVLATIPFRKIILLISPKSFKIKRIQLGLHLVPYLEYSTLTGVEMIGSDTLYLQALTVSDKARGIPLPKHLGDEVPVWIRSLVITENILIAGRRISLDQIYVRVCKMAESAIVSYCNKASHLDNLTIKYYNQHYL
ncbi:Hypothetical predicted protein [Octopus vulgaris]|uniref:Uncharacterized protein n=1 Tax=Octopus vulgaris TaxID=6645 RepID=A0AA36BZA5_OCTVU|nr:Hypothetical predicted protein [Octopus vulgaris]